MRIKPLNKGVLEKLRKFGLKEKFGKQARLFEANPAHPSLNTEKLEPKSVGLYSFRVNLKYRAIFRIRDGAAEILMITKHYQKQ